MVEIYEKNLQTDDITVRIDAQQADVLLVTLRGKEYRFELFEAASAVQLNLKRTKAEIQLTVSQHFPFLLKAESRINDFKQRKYQLMDQLGAEEKKLQKPNSNEFFKKLYDQGSNDQKMAMIKSMQESGGTVLSTNWENVSKERVQPRRGD